ncbi:hypothetical protein [Nonomuraea sp. SYSU D8015]|uniref:hypothetical protein n=1 Tax=Nonomuraea sp. SYSU D8015 TaxID=2593644 RepID=UPI001660176C|nr:hypothetical protein [Nonomuraea sp. SYSU D8015]
MNDTPQYRAMLTYDIENYSECNNTDQYALQSAMIRLLDLAAGAAGLGLLDWKRQPQGDGEFVVLPPDVHPGRLLGPFTDALRQAIDAHNASSQPRLRLRLAVHAGPIHVDGPAGSPGKNAVESGRLVNADALRTALRAVKAANLGVIVSDTFYADYVGQGYGGPPADHFRRVKAKVKQQEYIAYVHLPEHNVHAVPELREFDAEDTPNKAGGGQPPEGRQVSVGRDWYGGNDFHISGGTVHTIAGRDVTINDPGREPRP